MNFNIANYLLFKKFYSKRHMLHHHNHQLPVHISLPSPKHISIHDSTDLQPKQPSLLQNISKTYLTHLRFQAQLYPKYHLNLPKYDGRQLLETIKSDPDLSLIPVVVLTTSSAEEDILRSYKLHANAYVTKPVDLDQFMNAVRQIDEFFVQVVRLPQH